MYHRRHEVPHLTPHTHTSATGAQKVCCEEGHMEGWGGDLFEDSEEYGLLTLRSCPGGRFNCLN
jgi:hypothetical protein